MSHFHNNALIGASGQGGAYNLESSLRFRSSANAYLERTPTTTSNRKTWTWSGWVKRGAFGTRQAFFSADPTTGYNNNNHLQFGWQTDNTFQFGLSTAYVLVTNAVYRDPSSWYHVVLAIDTTQATVSNRAKLYINGSQVTSFSTNNISSLISQNMDLGFNLNSSKHLLGMIIVPSNSPLDGYMTEVNFVDGQALTADDFGETDTITGVWKPKEYTGTYGTNGFYLPMKETQQATGFNTVLYTGTGATQTIDNVGFSPDLVWLKNRSGFYHHLYDSVRGTTKALYSNATTAETTETGGLTSFNNNGFTLGNSSTINQSGGSIVAWCWDAGSDNTTGSELVTNGTFDSGTTGWTNVNCSISGTNQKLNATYSSSGAYVYQEVTGLTVGQKYILSFQSTGSNDFIRILRDAQTEALGGTFISFLGGNATTTSGLNQVFFEAPTSTVYINFNVPNGGTIIIDDISMKEISWDGSIPSYYKANPSTGFSIISWTGTGSAGTIGHGLGVSPKFIIVKDRGVNPWVVYHDSLGVQYYTLMDTDAASYNNLSDYWSATAPSSTVFGTNSYGGTNTSGHNYVAYCFSEVAGYSKFGSYTGNGSVGNSVTGLGFEPAFLLIKNATDLGGSGESWYLYDNARDPVDTRYHKLQPNDSGAESTSTVNNLVDFDSDGFTIQSTNAGLNYNGDTYIYMAFADTRDAQFNFDASGNKNNWTATNINSNASSETTYDIMNDVPTLTDEDTANFATWNPLTKTDSSFTLTNGNLTLSGSDAGKYATILASSGKFYCELYVNGTSGAGNGPYIRVMNDYVADGSTISYANYSSNGVGINKVGGSFPINGAWGSAWSAGNTVGVAFDLDNNTVTFYLNNTSQGTMNIDANVKYGVFYFDNGSNGNSINFGQRPFKYTPPTGYKKLNTYNLPNSNIVDGSQYFDTLLYTGNGSNRSITGLEFSPDLVIGQSRSNAIGNWWFDTVRGATKQTQTFVTNAESTQLTMVTAFNSDGFDLGTDGAGNGNGYTFVAWNWRGSDSAAVTNTDGTITSTVSANPTSGFSIMTYTGNATQNATVGHGLGVAPSVVLFKNRNTTNSWFVYHKSIGVNYFLQLNSSVAAVLDSRTNRPWGTPSATTLTLGIDAEVNGSGNGMVAYCFAEVEGFSKFGSYTGNGSTDGPFIYTGFRPAFIMTKNSSSSGEWEMYDTSRGSYNAVTSTLEAQSSTSELNYYTIDILSNGFKQRNYYNTQNQSGATFIYMAFAENPFKNSLAR